MKEGDRGVKENIVAIKNWTCNQTWEKYIKIDLFRCAEEIFFMLNLSIFILLSFESTLVVIWFIKAQFSNLHCTNSLFWAFWA